ncbi:hypothetical protein PC128_g12768 [Phytophthora cactorum]|nr:hypothetical protein PC128_g12768 [Phytophthora cactorum]
MDGDKAQYNACRSELPSSTILTCWFHVMHNVFKKTWARGVEPKQTQQFI